MDVIRKYFNDFLNYSIICFITSQLEDLYMVTCNYMFFMVLWFSMNVDLLTERDFTEVTPVTKDI